MATMVVIVLLVAAVAASFVPERFSAWLRIVGALALAFGLAGFAFLFLGPKDYLTRWPSLASWCHPYQLVLYSAAAVLLGSSTWLGLIARDMMGRRTRSAGGQDR